MFLVDKYYNNSKYITHHQKIIDKILKKFDNSNDSYIENNIDEIIKLPNKEFGQIINNLKHNNNKYSNFQHLILYGSNDCDKEYLVNRLLEKIYGNSGTQTKEVEYVVNGYSNIKTKIMIKQSKHHIVIEPNSNGFDKYLVQEIIHDYAKSELLDIVKQKFFFKVIVINKIDYLSYYAQSSLRRTMEKYSNTCKFILISDQLSKIIEPLRSRCLLTRINFPSNCEILESLLYICDKENISIKWSELNQIIKKSNNKINYAIWLLEMYKYDVSYDKNWEQIIDNITNMILDPDIKNNRKLYSVLKKIREQFYILFITNISTQTIIRKIMTNLINKINNYKLNYQVINITSIFEQRLNQGTRHIIHVDAYIIRLIQLFTSYNYSLNILEI